MIAGIFQQLGSLFFAIVLPIVVVILIGVLLDRLFRIDLPTLAKFNLYVFVPAFLFHRLVISDIPGGQQLLVVAFTLCVIASMGLVSFAVAALTRLPEQSRKALQLSTMFFNAGNFGIPLMTLAYPETGPATHAFVLMTINISTFTVGVWLANSQNGDHPPGWWRKWLPTLRQPSLYAIALAMTLKSLGLSDDVQNLAAIWRPIGFLADCLVGIALITLGVQLSQSKPPPIRGSMSWALAIRLIGGPLIAAGLVRLFGFEGDTAAILILGASAPTAVNTALLAHEFKADERFAAAAVFYTTILSAVTVTALMLILR